VTAFGCGDDGPDRLGMAVQVSAGGGHPCAVNDVGVVTCWGNDDCGQRTVPQTLGKVVGANRSDPRFGERWDQWEQGRFGE